ncbi:hypothetical protein [Deinococcus sonorensis]|uniref:OmpR/PhoB-type domain-containing protein n=2 Tax=Deinococcus sonorensis TaxID=309891 RepID=A0AAU7U584_9DEIO
MNSTVNTVMLIGPNGPTANSFMGLLSGLKCRVLRSSTVRALQHTIQLQLAIVEYLPAEYTLAAFTAQLHRLQPVPTVVVGPELTAQQVEQLTAPGAAQAYLPLQSSMAARRQLIQAQLPNSDGRTLRVGQLSLDPQDQSVRYGADPLPLTATEYRLLRSLMQVPGQLLSCAALEALTSCSDIQAHLGSVRRKLFAASAPLLVRGSRRSGYVIDARVHSRAPRSADLALRTHLRQLF